MSSYQTKTPERLARRERRLYPGALYGPWIANPNNTASGQSGRSHDSRQVYCASLTCRVGLLGCCATFSGRADGGGQSCCLKNLERRKGACFEVWRALGHSKFLRG